MKTPNLDYVIHGCSLATKMQVVPRVNIRSALKCMDKLGWALSKIDLGEAEVFNAQPYV